MTTDNGMSLVNATEGTLTARYEFGPFGDPLRSTGAMGPKNPFRFSTQCTDPHSVSSAAVKNLGGTGLCAKVVEAAHNPVPLVFSMFLPSITTVYERAEYAFLENRAWIWTRMTLSHCEKRRCRFLFGKPCYDWKQKPPSAWRQCTIGLLPGEDEYAGRSDAMDYAPPGASTGRARGKVTFNRFEEP